MVTKKIWFTAHVLNRKPNMYWLIVICNYTISHMPWLYHYAFRIRSTQHWKYWHKVASNNTYNSYVSGIGTHFTTYIYVSKKYCSTLLHGCVCKCFFINSCAKCYWSLVLITIHITYNKRVIRKSICYVILKIW